MTNGTAVSRLSAKTASRENMVKEEVNEGEEILGCNDHVQTFLARAKGRPFL